MPSKKNRKKKKDVSSKQSVTVAPSPLSGCRQPSFPQMEMSPPAKMPTGFNVDDFLFSKLYKSVNVEGRRAINEVLQVIFQQRAEANASTYTVQQLLKEASHNQKRMNPFNSHLDESLLKTNLLHAEFDVTCGIRLLEKVFYDDYKKLSSHCQAQIHTFRELRNSLSHNYPLVHHESEQYGEELNILSKKNEELGILLNEIKKLEEKISSINVAKEVDELKEHINEKKKEMYVITEIEKLKVILTDILEDASKAFETDLTTCKKTIDENLTDISKARVQQYNQSTYNEEVERFKSDPVHELITKAREELKQQYKKVRVANPCPWMVWDQAEKSSVASFCIDKIFTPLRIEDPKTEIPTEELLMAKKNIGRKISVPPGLVVSGLPGSGKTSLCLYFLHHWAESTHEIKTLKDYNLVIFVEMRTIRSDTLVDYLKTQRMKKSTSGISSEDLVQRLDDLKLLFIIDGYDEAKKSSQKIVEDIFGKFSEQRILVTTRAEYCDEVKRIATKHRVEYLTAEIRGFDEPSIGEFTNKVFTVINQSSYIQSQTHRPRDSAEFLRYLNTRGKILEKLRELPLTLALMIYLWVDCPDTLSRVTTCTSLYYELFCLYQKKLQDRLKDPCPDITIEKLLLLVGKKAWQLLMNEETVLSKEDEKEVEEQCTKEGISKEELMSAFLVYKDDDNSPEYRYDYSFVHKTQMEYLSAYFLVEETGKESLQHAIKSFTGFRYYQVIFFIVGHFARKKKIEENLIDIFALLNISDITLNDYNFWWNLVIESQKNKALLLEVCRTKLNQNRWQLFQNNVVSGLELLMVVPIRLKELIIEIQETDPYDVKDLLSTMKAVQKKFCNRRQHYKEPPILTELFFWHHAQVKCPKPSDQLIKTLYPWGHLKDFVGSVGEQPEKYEVLNYCYRLKNLRVRVDSCGAQVCLANSLKRIGRSVGQLRVTLAVDPKECDVGTLTCLTDKTFKGDLELTLPNMNNENKNWIVRVVEHLSGTHGCEKLFLKNSSFSFPTVLYIMKELCNVIHRKLTVESNFELTLQQMKDLEKQEHATHMEVNWIGP